MKRATLTAGAKPRKCAVCPTRFIPRNSMHKACSLSCALTFARKHREKAERKQAREQKARIKQLEPISKLLERAQRACNEYIRERDRGLPCISCGKHCKWMEAGHYRPVGAGGASPARLHPDNIHLQCHPCNHFNGGGNHAGYRPNLVAKIGEDRVQAVERLHAMSVKWDRANIEQLAVWFRAEARKIRKLREGESA